MMMELMEPMEVNMKETEWLKVVYRCSQIYIESGQANDVASFMKWLYKQYGVEFKPPTP